MIKQTFILLSIIVFLFLIMGAAKFAANQVSAATVCTCTKDCGTATECTYCVDSVTNFFVSNTCLSPTAGGAGSTLPGGGISCGGTTCTCTDKCGTETECTYCTDKCGNFVSNACKTAPAPTLNCTCTKDCGLPTQCLYCTDSATGAFVASACGVPSATAQGVCVPVYCDIEPVCTGTCSVACGAGTKDQCTYTKFSGGGTCLPASAPDQPCSPRACIPPLSPWIQVIGGDVHSNANINP